MSVTLGIGSGTGRVLRLPIDDARWSNFVKQRNESLAFHLPAWSMTLTNTYGWKSFCIVRQEADGTLAAGLPIVAVSHFGRCRWASLPFTDVCFPLGDEPEQRALLSATESFAAEAGVGKLEIRSDVGLPGTTAARGLIHELRLEAEPDQLLKTFSKSQVQRNISRARRSGVLVRRGERREDLLEVFFGLHLDTRRRLGLPSQPRRFFEHLWDQMLVPGHGFVLIAYVRDRPAAAAVFLLGAETVTYKYGASNASLWPERPNHLLFWEAICWSCANGYRTFDFGRTDWESEGLRAFKRGWGTVERELVYSTLGQASSQPKEASFRPSQMSLSLLRPLLRHSPCWLNQAVGSVLYRFAA